MEKPKTLKEVEFNGMTGMIATSKDLRELGLQVIKAIEKEPAIDFEFIFGKNFGASEPIGAIKVLRYLLNLEETEVKR